MGLAAATTFEALTPQLPTDLPAVFDCQGGTRIVGGANSDNPWSFFVQLRQGSPINPTIPGISEIGITGSYQKKMPVSLAYILRANLYVGDM